jgi:CubicO group peptidase (beta-lactamase class C family)
LKAALTEGTEYGQLDAHTTSFSIDVYSITQATPLFTYHYSAPGLSNPVEGVAKVDSNTIFRVGSASKLWTVYLYLIEAGDVSFKEPITKYIPELATYAKTNAAALANDGTDITAWKDITIGALASQMAGIARDAAPAASQDAKLVAAGLPPVPPVHGSFCGDPAQEQLPCDRAGKLRPMFL